MYSEEGYGSWKPLYTDSVHVRNARSKRNIWAPAVSIPINPNPQYNIGVPARIQQIIFTWRMSASNAFDMPQGDRCKGTWNSIASLMTLMFFCDAEAVLLLEVIYYIYYSSISLSIPSCAPPVWQAVVGLLVLEWLSAFLEAKPNISSSIFRTEKLVRMRSLHHYWWPPFRHVVCETSGSCSSISMGIDIAEVNPSNKVDIANDV